MDDCRHRPAGRGGHGLHAVALLGAAGALLPPIELYDLSVDVGEGDNGQAEHPEIVEELKNLLTKYIREGRSTPGQRQKNTGSPYWAQLTWLLEEDMV